MFIAFSLLYVLLSHVLIVQFCKCICGNLVKHILFYIVNHQV